MPLFGAAVRAQASGRTVKAALFVHFAFRSEDVRVWEGDGPLDRGGHAWRGMGHRQDGEGNPLQSIDGLEAAVNGNAPQLMLTLSGIDRSIVAAASRDHLAGEIDGRDLRIWMGFFDADEDGLVPLDDLMEIGWWIMQAPEFIADGPKLRTVRLAAETPFAQRSRAPHGQLTSIDQERRYPGDLGLDRIPTMVDRVVTWPRF